MTPLERAIDAVGHHLIAEGQRRGIAVDVDGDIAQIDGGFMLEPLVRAVLSAIREPSEAILKAMRDTVPVDGHEWEYRDDEAVPHWQAMIDAALAEEG